MTGDGPVYIAGGSDIALPPEPASGDGSYVVPLTWTEAGSQAGVAFLVRGRRIDEPGSVTLGLTASALAPELFLTPAEQHPAATPGLARWTGYVGLPGPGCYGLQIDGPTFGEVITFVARHG